MAHSNNATAPPEWKQFQDAVASIERILGNKGTVESPARIADRRTGRKREIDVLITLREGRRDLKIAMECRRRNHKSDVTWIEQLIGKRDNLGLDRVVAVSAKPFSEGAVALARDRFIEIMELSVFYSQEWEPWLECKHIDVCTCRSDFQYVYVQCATATENRSYDSEESCFVNESGEMLSFSQLWNSNSQPLYAGITPNEKPKRVQARIHVTDDAPIYVMLERGQDRVLHFDIVADLYIEQHPVPLRSAMTYRNILDDQIVLGYTETLFPIQLDNSTKAYLGFAKIPADGAPQSGGTIVVIHRPA